MRYGVFDYLKKYIEKNNINVSPQEAFIMVGYINSRIDPKKYSEKDVKSGLADEYINLLIDQYNKNMSGDTIDYNALYRYVSTLLVGRYPNVLNLLSKEEFATNVRKIVLNITGDGEKEYSKYIDGSYDEKFIDGFKEVINLAYDECCFSVSVVLHKANINYYNNKNLIYGTVDEILKENKKEDLMYGFKNDVIIEKYNYYIKKLKTEIERYVRKFLEKKELLFGVPIDKVVEYVINRVIVIGDFNPEDLFNKKYNKEIDMYADSKNKFNVTSKSRSYILNLIREKSNGLISDDMIYKMLDDIYTKFIKDEADLEKVTRGRFDKEIASYIEKKMMMLSSVEDKNKKEKSKGIKHKTKKRKMDKKSWFLLLLILIMILLGIKGYNNLKEEIDYTKQVTTIKGDYGFDHYYVFSYDNDFVQVDAENALKFYCSLNDAELSSNNYKYLGFYLAYLNTGQDRLYIMDEEFDRAKNKSHVLMQYSEVEKNISSDRCFLEFAMNRLYQMGYKEIRDAKYVAALNSYINAMKKNSKIKPMESDFISEEHKEIIEEIMEKYREYSRELMEEYLEEVDEENKAEELKGTTLDANGSRRKI